jgi:hypothetical protein
MTNAQRLFQSYVGSCKTLHNKSPRSFNKPRVSHKHDIMAGRAWPSKHDMLTVHLHTMVLRSFADVNRYGTHGSLTLGTGTTPE